MMSTKPPGPRKKFLVTPVFHCATDNGHRELDIDKFINYLSMM